VTPQVLAQLCRGARVRITVTLLDGALVTESEATALAVDRRRQHHLVCVTDDNRPVTVPLDPVDATVLPLPRPTRPGGAA
jgi:hypothetical protein